jgi:hypothetical protein
VSPPIREVPFKESDAMHVKLGKSIEVEAFTAVAFYARIGSLQVAFGRAFGWTLDWRGKILLQRACNARGGKLDD